NIESSSCIAAVAGIVGRLTISCYKECAFIGNGVDWIAKIDGTTPFTTRFSSNKEQIIVAISRPVVAGEIKCKVICMNKWTLVVARSIHIRAKVFRLAPSAIGKSARYIDVGTSISSEAPAREIEFLFIGRETGL